MKLHIIKSSTIIIAFSCEIECKSNLFNIVKINNLNIEKHHSIEIILDDLNGEELIGHAFNKDDPFSLDPIATDIGMQLKKLDRNLIYEKIFEVNEDNGKDISVEYGLISSKKYDSSFLIYL